MHISLYKLCFITVFLSQFLLAQTIQFDGLNYKVIKSSVTQKEWLDRNLGAKRACISSVDERCFGDYYQWGRKSDGHQKVNAKVINKSEIQNTKSTAFINVKSKIDFDWRSTSNDNLWKGINSQNNVCPKGFRVPTMDELKSEMNGKTSFLNIPLAGYKSFCNGNLVQSKKQGALWSSSVYEKDAYYLDVRNDSIDSSTSSRADAFSVRCIKEK